MTGILKSPTSRRFLFVLLRLLITTNLAVLLDIPVLRQITSFIFLFFVPGFLLLLILKLDKLGLVEKVVLSAGLGLTFTMFFGLLLNYVLPAIGYKEPLSTVSLLVSFSLATVVLAALAYIRNRNIVLSFSNFRLTTGEKAFLIMPSLFPLLSIIGMRVMNLTDNNLLLMFMLFLIPAYVVFLSFSRGKVSEKVYPIAIFLISISLLLMYSLRSNHIIGSDTHRELFTFQTIVTEHRWSQVGISTLLDSCLSISLLPAVYQAFLNINPEYLFKLLPSLIVSLLPLTVYILSKKYVGSFYAFLTSAFLMSQIVFLWTLSFARINIAIFFFGLAIMVIFHDAIDELSKKALFILFGASTIVSHYGVAYIFFFVLLFAWVMIQILSFIAARRKGVAATLAENAVLERDPPGRDARDRAAALRMRQTRLNRGITFSIVLLFLAMLFLWYSEMTGPTFRRGVEFVYKTFATGAWFFDERTSQPVQAAFGRTMSYAQIPQKIEFVFSWLTIILLSFGLLAMLSRTLIRRFVESKFLLRRFEIEYFAFSIACYLMLVATVILPVASQYGAARTYLQMVVLLSVFVIIGGIEVAKYLKVRPHWLILFILVPYFLSTTGWMSQVFNSPRAITLNSRGELYSRLYVFDAESYATKWMKKYYDAGELIYTSKNYGRDVLLSQGRIQTYDRVLNQGGVQTYLAARALDLGEDKKVGGYIFLRRTDVVGNVVVQYPIMFADKSLIYANGSSEVYR